MRRRWKALVVVVAIAVSATVGTCVVGVLWFFATPQKRYAVSLDCASTTRCVISNGTMLALINKDGTLTPLGPGKYPAFLGHGPQFLFLDAQGNIVLSSTLTKDRRIVYDVPSRLEVSGIAYDTQARRVYFTMSATMRRNAFGGTVGHKYDLYACGLDGRNLKQLTFGGFYRMNLMPRAFGKESLFYVAADAKMTQPRGEIWSLSLQDSKPKIVLVPDQEPWLVTTGQNQPLWYKVGRSAPVIELRQADQQGAREKLLRPFKGLAWLVSIEDELVGVVDERDGQAKIVWMDKKGAISHEIRLRMSENEIGEDR